MAAGMPAEANKLEVRSVFACVHGDAMCASVGDEFVGECFRDGFRWSPTAKHDLLISNEQKSAASDDMVPRRMFGQKNERLQRTRPNLEKTGLEIA
jgi:hypothetical protein